MIRFATYLNIVQDPLSKCSQKYNSSARECHTKLQHEKQLGYVSNQLNYFFMSKTNSFIIYGHYINGVIFF